VQVVALPAARVLAPQAMETLVMVGSGVSVMTAEADFDVLATLVAVTVTDDPVEGAVRTPAGVMLPAVADHVTAFEIVPVVVTVGVQVVLAVSMMLVDEQATETAVTAFGAFSARVTEPDFVGS